VPDAHEALLEFSYSDPDHARIVERSVRQEVGDIEGDRTRASVDRANTLVTVTVSAADLVALRAGVNTWTTLVSVADATAETAARS